MSSAFAHRSTKAVPRADNAASIDVGYRTPETPVAKWAGLVVVSLQRGQAT